MGVCIGQDLNGEGASDGESLHSGHNDKEIQRYRETEIQGQRHNQAQRHRDVK